MLPSAMFSRRDMHLQQTDIIGISPILETGKIEA